VNGILPLGSKENLLDLEWMDRYRFAFGVVSELGTKVQEVRDAEEGFGQANLHPGLGGIIFTNPLRRRVKVCVHDLDVSLDQQNVAHEGKAPEVVPGLSDGSDGSPMSAKIRVQRSNHRLIRPVGGRGSDDHNLLARGAMGDGPFTTGLCPFRIGGGSNGSTRHYLLGVNNGGSGSGQEGLGQLDKPCLGSSSTLPPFGRRGLGEGNSSGCRCCE
jgi:hypothetical protein